MSEVRRTVGPRPPLTTRHAQHPARNERTPRTVETNHVQFIWNIAESLRGPYKPAEYGDVALPFTILRRLDQVLAPTKQAVLDKWEELKENRALADLMLPDVSGHAFYNTSGFDFARLLSDPQNVRANLTDYASDFSRNVHDIFEKFEFDNQLAKLDEAGLLYTVVKQFAGTDLHPSRVSNIQMGLIFEELIRKFNEASNETAGDHYTPREVISLMVQLLFTTDDDALGVPGTARSIYDPTAGTGGMLSVADDYLRSQNASIDLNLYGQDYNAHSYAVCKADMVIKGQGIDNIKHDNTLTRDQFPDRKFDYVLSNPPFGVDWKAYREAIENEHTGLGFSGRFGAGLPRVSDGSLLFLQHVVSKMRTVADGGSRVGIVLNGSPLFSGGAGSGESKIRKHLLESDLVEAIIGLPKDMFYNTGISTYIWVLTNRKTPERRGKVQLVDGREMYRKMRKGIGSKRNELSPDNIAEIVKIHDAFEESDVSKIFDNEDFFYRTITIERPLRLNFAATTDRIDAVFEAKPVAKLDEDTRELLRGALEGLPDETWKNRDAFLDVLNGALRRAGIKLPAPAKKAVVAALSEQDDTADICTDRKGTPEPDPSLRDTENVPWRENIDTYVEREVKPYAPDAWVDYSKTKEGAEIPFTRHFYRYVAPRPLDDIDRDLEGVLTRLRGILAEVEA